MNSDNLKNDLSERENLSAGERKIRDLIGGLEKVSAPKDFDFRLKARISAAKENNFQPSVWRTLRYALPLTAVLIIAAFVMIQAGLFSATENRQIAVENPKREIPLNSQSLMLNKQIAQISNSSFDKNKTEEKMPDSFVVEPKPAEITTAKNPTKKTDKKTLLVSSRDESPRSKDFTVRPSNINIKPEGIPANTVSANKEINQNNSVSVQEVLNLIGVETEPQGNKLKVKSVREKSLAGISGVKSGDFIEAIDGQKLDQKNSPPKLNGAKNITVTRESKTLTIELKP